MGSWGRVVAQRASGLRPWLASAPAAKTALPCCPRRPADAIVPSLSASSPTSGVSLGRLGLPRLPFAALCAVTVTCATSFGTGSATAAAAAQKHFKKVPFSTTAACANGAVMASETMQTTAGPVSFLSQADAQHVDVRLMSEDYGYSLDQLMELAGLSVAVAANSLLADVASTTPHRVLVLVGPGNNGGDGLVAARHLSLFGWQTDVVYPKRPARPPFAGLQAQCRAFGIDMADTMPDLSAARYDLIIDAMFGFSFKADPTKPETAVRAPFDTMISAMNAATTIPVLAVDIPSGWDVERGDIYGVGTRCDALISLTAPKLCAKSFGGRHFVGGRFVPPSLSAEMKLKVPTYTGHEQIVEITA